MNDNLLFIVTGMAVVTYLPRLIPMLFFHQLDLPPFLQRFLRFIPYAVLTSLIFPGILFSTGNPVSALAGGLVAVILALYEVNLFLVVIGSICGVFLTGLF
ncbi:AzlD domain-containing protein [Halothermothrix orenii]|uniref:Branched-chain amino acid transport n=1 Tax=Halothermothrix orenii (strain H 168 / OCM 544 / DSM 9562) TaxID=373903 RepID=B8D0X5_HALOH|nr:AzlD domain-containing protein [Halothermothrix orenii]ACL68944.1 branched-chain amino acid transport [Halothermothrix orenii H 168]